MTTNRRQSTAAHPQETPKKIQGRRHNALHETAKAWPQETPEEAEQRQSGNPMQGSHRSLETQGKEVR